MARITSKFINWGTGTDQVNARAMPANYTPGSYSGIAVASEGTDKVSSHLKGIDQRLKASLPSTGTYYWDDFLFGAPIWTQSVNGGGTSFQASTAVQDQTHMGIFRAISGAAGGRNSLYLATNPIQHGGGDELLEWIVYIDGAPDGTIDYTLRSGTGDTVAVNGDHANGLYFEINRAVSTTNWLLKSASSSVRTSVTTSIAFASATWYRLSIRLSGGVASFYINGTLAGSISTNIPTTNLSPSFKVEKTLNNTARNIYIDQFYYEKIFTTPR